MRCTMISGRSRNKGTKRSGGAPRVLAIFVVALVCSILPTVGGIAYAQPGIGGGGAGIYGGGGGGQSVVVTGTYTSVPSGGGTTGSAPAAVSGGGGGSAAPSGPPLEFVPTTDSGMTFVRNADTGAPMAMNVVNDDGTTWSCEAVGPCVQIPDVGLPATPPVVDVMTVVGQAVTAMQLDPPRVGITPNPASTGAVGLVGLPGWFWVADPRESTVGPVTRTAAGPGVVVNATAVNTSVIVNWGDGSVPSVCPGALLPFTPYTDAAQGLPSPTCGNIVYHKTSTTEPGGTFKVSATSNWLVTWTATTPNGTVGGVIPTPLTSRTEVRIGELQVLVTN